MSHVQEVQLKLRRKKKFISTYQQDPGTAHMYCPILDKTSQIWQICVKEFEELGTKYVRGPELLLSLGLMGYFSFYNWYNGSTITIPCYRIDSTICSSKEGFFLFNLRMSRVFSLSLHEFSVASSQLPAIYRAVHLWRPCFLLCILLASCSSD